MTGNSNLLPCRLRVLAMTRLALLAQGCLESQTCPETLDAPWDPGSPPARTASANAPKPCSALLQKPLPVRGRSPRERNILADLFYTRKQ